jgi:hypothetical protein
MAKIKRIIGVKMIHRTIHTEQLMCSGRERKAVPAPLVNTMTK